MISKTLLLTSVPWPVFVLAAWLLTILVIATMVYGIAKAAINKTDARDLPAVLTALTGLVKGVTRSVGQVSGTQIPGQGPTAPAQDAQPSAQGAAILAQTNGTSGQTGIAGIGATTEAAQ
jgi:hypothetical protein